MATIVDISRETGLARTTVAEVLRGKAGYSQASRDRVAAAARRLGYRPNYLSKALHGGKSMSMGAIWPMRGVTGDVDVAMALLEEAQGKGYAVYHAEHSNDLEKRRRLVREYADRRVDALLLWSDSGSLLELSEDLSKLPAVVALNDQPINDFRCDVLILDRTAAITEVVDHLAASGRNRPAIVLDSTPSQQHKIEWFRGCCRRWGMRADERSLVNLRAHRRPRPPRGGEIFDKPTLDPEMMADYFHAYEKHFCDGVDIDALLCGTDQGAMAAIRFLTGRGLRVPQDVAVIGWNNVPAAPLWTPPLASIDRSQDATIKALRDLLLGRLESPEGGPRQQTVHMKFVWRESAGKPAGDATNDSHIL
jgi:DNA-binding LacI/PurR family transcriptional regulator